MSSSIQYSPEIGRILYSLPIENVEFYLEVYHTNPKKDLSRWQVIKEIDNKMKQGENIDLIDDYIKTVLYSPTAEKEVAINELMNLSKEDIICLHEMFNIPHERRFRFDRIYNILFDSYIIRSEDNNVIDTTINHFFTKYDHTETVVQYGVSFTNDVIFDNRNKIISINDENPIDPKTLYKKYDCTDEEFFAITDKKYSRLYTSERTRLSINNINTFLNNIFNITDENSIILWKDGLTFIMEGYDANKISKGISYSESIKINNNDITLFKDEELTDKKRFYINSRMEKLKLETKPVFAFFVYNTNDILIVKNSQSNINDSLISSIVGKINDINRSAAPREDKSSLKSSLKSSSGTSIPKSVRFGKKVIF